MDMHNRLDDLQMDIQTKFDRVNNKINQVERKITIYWKLNLTTMGKLLILQFY